MTRHIESAWERYRRVVLPPDASPVQVSETRKAFFAGAAVLFTSLMIGLDEDSEPTLDDMQRMQDIADELQAFGEQLDVDVLGGGVKH